MNRTHAIVVLSLIFLFVSRIFFALTPWQTLISLNLWLDDSFYYFQISKTWLDTGELSFDSITKTNGFQPLYLILVTPLVAIFDNSTSLINAVHIIGIFVGLGSFYFIYKITDALTDKMIAALAVMIFATSPYFLIHSMNGMETGMTMFCGLIFIYGIFVRPFKKDLANNLLIGFSVGLMILARIDQAILILSVLIASYIFDAGRTDIKRFPLKQILIPFIIITLPWYGYTFIKTGAMLPQSGAASRYCAHAVGLSGFSADWQSVLTNFGLNDLTTASQFYILVVLKQFIVFMMDFSATIFIRPDLSMGSFSDPFRSMFFSEVLRSSYKLILLLVVCISLMVLGVSQINKLNNPRTKVFVGATIIYFVLQFIGYTFYAPVHWYFSRYLVSVQLLMFISFLIMISGCPFRSSRIFSYLLVVAIVCVNLKLISPVFKLHKIPVAIGGFYLETRELSKLLPANSRVGAFQAGILSWFGNSQIINLDGKANSSALEAIADNRLGDYILREKIQYIYDWPTLILAYLARDKSIELREISGNYEGNMRLYRVSASSQR
jgi:hypothetical protein